jgi:3-oxoadipate enol-lactonase
VNDLLAYDVRGSGTPVLLLHSSVANRQMWDPQWPALAASHQVVRCDLRAFGETPVPAASWNDADDVIALLDHLEIERTAVVGASYGGRIALEVATLAPQRVSRLVLLCPGGDAPSTPDVEAFSTAEDELLATGDLEGAVALNVRTWLGPEAEPQVRQLLAGWQRETFEVQLAAPDDIGPQHPDVDPSTVLAPTTVVTGAHDLAHFRGIAADLTERIPRSRLVDLPWAGHLPNLERPQEIIDLLLHELR